MKKKSYLYTQVLTFFLVHVLLATSDEFEKMEEKQKLPKPKLTQEVKNVIENILKKRLEQRYNTSLEVNSIIK